MNPRSLPEPGAGVEMAFQPLALGRLELPNRLVRSATYEGLATRDGQPRPELGDCYAQLAQGGVGAVITGFAFVAPEGRAMQPGQCGMESDERIAPWRTVLGRARQGHPETRFFLQLAHAGRQTRQRVTGRPVLGASSRRCTYFRQAVRPMTAADIGAAIDAFGHAARRAREAGFDGVQLHAAHGYLIHQFLSPWTNRRNDPWGDRPRFLEEVLRAVRPACGQDFPVLVKLSAADDNTPGIRLDDTRATVQRIAPLGVAAVEVSYGTMEYALNIIRGACPTERALKVNPLFRDLSPLARWLWTRFRMRAYVARFLPFTETYNLSAAVAIRHATGVPVIATGGVSSAAGVARCLAAGVDAVGMCRTLIREPAFPRRLRADPEAVAACTHCNLCTIHSDSDRPLHCYQRKEAPRECP